MTSFENKDIRKNKIFQINTPARFLSIIFTVHLHELCSLSELEHVLCDFGVAHCSDVTWASWRLKSLETRPFSPKKTSKSASLTFCEGKAPMDSPIKGLLSRKCFQVITTLWSKWHKNKGSKRSERRMVILNLQVVVSLQFYCYYIIWDKPRSATLLTWEIKSTWVVRVMHCVRNKWPPFCRRYFQVHFLE